MSSNIIPKQVGAVETISYFAHTRPLVSAGGLNANGLLTAPLEFFGSSTAKGTATGCDLNQGVLPDNASGHLRYIGFQFFVSPAGGTANQLQLLRTVSALPHHLRFEANVNSIRCLESPVSMFGAPAPVLQGIADIAASTSNAAFASGPMNGAAMLDHPIGSAQTIQVVASSRFVLPTLLRPTAGTDEPLIYAQCVIGVALARALVTTR